MRKIFWGDPPADVDKPTWEPILVKPEGIFVDYQEKYGGLIHKECIGLWYDKVSQKYRLTYKDSNAIELMVCNLVSIEWNEKDAT
jgi:hypothetical protein